MTYRQLIQTLMEGEAQLDDEVIIRIIHRNPPWEPDDIGSVKEVQYVPVIRVAFPDMKGFKAKLCVEQSDIDKAPKEYPV